MSTYREKFIGIVTDNKDPEKRGRIKVKCAALCGADDSDEAVEYPAWIEPVFPIMFSDDGKKATAGWVFIPSPGVTVEMEMSVHDSFDRSPGQTSVTAPAPRWLGALVTRNDKLPDDLTKNYPDRGGLQTAAGHQLIFDDTKDQKKILIKHADGSFFSLDDKGSAVLATDGKDLIFVNNENGEITILNRHQMMITLTSSGMLLSAPGVFLSLGDGMIQIIGSSGVFQANSISLLGGAVSIGQAATHPLVFGDTLMAKLNAALTAIGAAFTAIGAVPAVAAAAAPCAAAAAACAAGALAPGVDMSVAHKTA